jgi:HrpA-like RNA helicase
VRLEKHPPRAHGGILFCTTGLLVRRFQVDPWLRGVSHILIDEVHERDLQQVHVL